MYANVCTQCVNMTKQLSFPHIHKRATTLGVRNSVLTNVRNNTIKWEGIKGKILSWNKYFRYLITVSF